MVNKRITKEKILKLLEEVNDPELNISLVDLGLIYNVKVIRCKAIITMTLTSVACPLFPLIEESIKQKIEGLKGIQETEIKLVFDPPWNIDKMTEKGKAIFGL